MFSLFDKVKNSDKLTNIFHCEQCGSCSSACPVTNKNDFNIRKILKYSELKLTFELINNESPIWICTTCGRCQDACPNNIEILSIIRSIRTSIKKKNPSFKYTIPCIENCPAHIDIPRYLRSIANKDFQKAYEIIMEKCFLPNVLGLLCTHPCEENCRRGEVNQPISICKSKNYIFKYVKNRYFTNLKPKKKSNHNIAIIGSGPAGLSAAFFLNKKGHNVTIFEAESKPGGMLQRCIPSYKLPNKILKEEIEILINMGVSFKLNKKLGKDFTLKELIKKGNHAIFLALGLQKSQKIDIKNTDHNEVFWGLEFLNLAKKRQLSLKKEIIVLGGGNVALDIAFTALKYGSKKITVISLEKEKDMPANFHQVNKAKKKGIHFLNSWGPEEIIIKNKKLIGLKITYCEKIEKNQNKLITQFNKNKNKMIKGDQIIFAIGQKSDLSCFSQEEYKNLIQNNLIFTNSKTLSTNIPNVFAGGDITYGPQNIIKAIASGKKAAKNIDKHLGGDGEIESFFHNENLKEVNSYSGKRKQGFADIKRKKITQKSNCQTVRDEASRCLQCDLEFKSL